MTGEEWLVKKVGAYLPGAYEEVVDIVDAYILTEKVPSISTSSITVLLVSVSGGAAHESYPYLH